MTNTPMPPRPFLNSIEPQLYVQNLQTACAFYTTRLGFEIAFLYGDPPHYAQVVRNHARLNLRLIPGPVFAGDIRQREALLSASITVATTQEIAQLYQDFQAAAVPIHQPLKDEPWGAKTFIIQDPDENLLLFAGPSAD